jgi:hypothetical protein
MKTIFTVGLLLFFGNLFAQTGVIDGIIINQIPKSKLLYEIEKGLVYALPQDNMKCLVPNFHSNMPIASAKIPGYIPNPFYKNKENGVKILPQKDFSIPKDDENKFLNNFPAENCFPQKEK